MKLKLAKSARQAALSGLMSLAFVPAHAALFEDNEARTAILDLRQRIEASRVASEQAVTRASEDNLVLRRSLLELQNQIELLRAELAKLRGMNEQLSRDISDSQRQQKDSLQKMDDRFKQFEPVKVTVDERAFLADPLEKRDFEAALSVFRRGDFLAAQAVFFDFIKRYGASGYRVPALFWLGNAQYAIRDYKEAMTNFRALIAQDPEHLRAPEAVLSIANCQIELKDPRGARKTLEDLVKAYPQSEAAVAAKERLARLK
jgi:tol-pal system protein YbgF